MQVLEAKPAKTCELSSVRNYVNAVKKKKKHTHLTVAFLLTFNGRIFTNIYRSHFYKHLTVAFYEYSIVAFYEHLTVAFYEHLTVACYKHITVAFYEH